jgi:hypothetical protein
LPQHSPFQAVRRTSSCHRACRRSPFHRLIGSDTYLAIFAPPSVASRTRPEAIAACTIEGAPETALEAVYDDPLLDGALGTLGEATGLWVHWLIEHDPDAKRKATTQQWLARLTTMGYQLIDNNRALFLPLQDQQAIEISLFLVLVGTLNGNQNDARAWLHEMAERLALTVRTHGRYPCVFTEYRDLVAHPRERSDAYRKEATSGSILIPLLAAFLSAPNDRDALETLVALKKDELEHCTLQLWIPDKSSEEGLYLGTHDHGVALCDLPLSTTGGELLKIVNDACETSKDFSSLSAIRTGFWPIILTACRHYRLPVPPQFWIHMAHSPPKA